MRLWAESKVLSYCISDWCESREMGGRWSSRLPTNGGKLLCRPSSYKKLLDRVTFWIVYVAWRVGYKIVAYNATSVGVVRRNILLCVCVAEAIIIISLSVLLCILLWWWCVKIAKWMGPISVNMRFQALCIILSFLSCFATSSYVQFHMKDFFLFQYFSKDSQFIMF